MAVSQLVYKTIKKAVNDELMPGGPTVIRSCVGVSKSLKFFNFHFNYIYLLILN